MAITEEEKQLREPERASLLTAASEQAQRAGAAAASYRRYRKQMADAVADSLAEAERRSWEVEKE